MIVTALRLPVETIGSRFGGIPIGLPPLSVPQFHVQLIPDAASPALTVALLGALESLMSAVVADRMSGDRHNPNVELVAQGIANIVSPLFGGLPATGAIARTATNIRSGARTPVAGIVHALTLLAVLLVAAPLARFVPLAVLAAILMVVAYNMGEWAEIPELLKLTKTDISVWLVTFVLDRLRRPDGRRRGRDGPGDVPLHPQGVADNDGVAVTDDYVESGRAHSLQDKQIPHYVSVFRIHGPFLFGATDKIRDFSINRRAGADRDPAAAEHDGDRRDRAARDRGSRRRIARVRPHADPLRRAAAGEADAAGRVPRHVGARTSARTSRPRWSGRRPCTRSPADGVPISRGGAELVHRPDVAGRRVVETDVLRVGRLRSSAK